MSAVGVSHLMKQKMIYKSQKPQNINLFRGFLLLILFKLHYFHNDKPGKNYGKATAANIEEHL